MMSNQFQQAYTTTDAQNNVTYIQFVNPSQSQIIYCKDDGANEQEYCYEDNEEEALDESYIEEDPIEESIEILESVVVEKKKTQSKTGYDHQVTKKLVQVTGLYYIFHPKFIFSTDQL